MKTILPSILFTFFSTITSAHAADGAFIAIDRQTLISRRCYCAPVIVSGVLKVSAAQSVPGETFGKVGSWKCDFSGFERTTLVPGYFQKYIGDGLPGSCYRVFISLPKGGTFKGRLPAVTRAKIPEGTLPIPVR